MKRRPRWEADARRELFQAALEFVITGRHSGSAGSEARKNKAWEAIVGKLMKIKLLKNKKNIQYRTGVDPDRQIT